MCTISSLKSGHLSNKDNYSRSQMCLPTVLLEKRIYPMSREEVWQLPLPTWTQHCMGKNYFEQEQKSTEH